MAPLTNQKAAFLVVIATKNKESTVFFTMRFEPLMENIIRIDSEYVENGK